MIALSKFRPIEEIEGELPWQPVIVKRDLSQRVRFTAEYHGFDRRHKLAISTWMGFGGGLLDREPHWDSFYLIPPVGRDPWMDPKRDLPLGGALLLLYLPNRVRTPFNDVRAGVHFGARFDSEWKVYKRLPRDEGDLPANWVSLPHGAVRSWVEIVDDEES